MENFTLADQTQEQVLPLIEEVAGVETNEKVLEILKAVMTTYGPQDSGTITSSVEAVELSTPQDPEFKIPIRDIVSTPHCSCLSASTCRRNSPFLRLCCHESIRRWDIRTAHVGLGHR